MIFDDETQSAPTLRDYLLILKRRKWTFLLVVLLVPTVAVLVSMHQQKTYQATAKVLLSQQSLPSIVTGVQQPSTVDPARVAQTQAQLARVPRVTNRVLRAVPEAELTLRKFLAASTVSAGAGSDLLTFAVIHTNPDIAIRLANEYARAFTTYRRSLDSEQIRRTRDSVQKQLAELEAENQRGSPLYRSLVETDSQLRTIEALQTPPAVVAEEAERATKVGPKTARNTALALVLGLLLGLGIVFLVEALDTRVRSVEAIRDVLGMRLLGSLPAPPRKLRRNRLVMVDAPMTYEAEPFRALRAGLEFANSQVHARTIMITSALDGEGKTTTAANLAVALARAGRHVVLVDFDLRNPSVHKFFDLGEEPGLVDIDLGGPVLENASRETQVAAGHSAGQHLTAANGRAPHYGGKLEILQAEHILNGPDDLGSELEVARIVQNLGKDADVVLIDAAPLLPVGDSIALSAHVDALLLVVKLNTLRESALEDVHRILSSSPVHKLGFVLTGAQTAQGYHRYRYPTSRLPHISRTTTPDPTDIEKRQQSV